MAWIVKLVRIMADGEEHCVDAMTINRPDDLGNIATLGLTLAEEKQLLAGMQRESVAAQAKDHAARQPVCRSCAEAKDAQSSIDRIRTVMPHFQGEQGQQRAIAPSQKLLIALHALDGYLHRPE